MIADKKQSIRIGDVTRRLKKILMTRCVKLAAAICKDAVVKAFTKMASLPDWKLKWVSSYKRENKKWPSNEPVQSKLVGQ